MSIRGAALLVLLSFASIASCVGDDPGATDPTDGGATSDAPGSDAGTDAALDSQTQQDAPADSPAADGEAGVTNKRVFVTSTIYDGNLKGGSASGFAGADAKCQARADVAGLGGTYKAWISPSTAVAQSAVVDRFSKPPLPHVRVDGKRVAPNWAALVAGPLEVPISISELGTDLADGGAPLAWSGTKSDGTATGSFSIVCDDWAANNGVASGQYGFPTATDGTWSFANAGKTCNESHHLYCFEQ